MSRPVFIITIDTEGDNLWARPDIITTENSKFLLRFQQLCESFAFKTTYLCDYEMACCRDFISLGKKIINNGTGEIGMHLHAWNTPPFYEKIDLLKNSLPYLTEYPESFMQEKISFLTKKLEEIFQIKPVSHRAGRWAFNNTYARLLADHAYKTDCSVTPKVSWTSIQGYAKYGTDYSKFPHLPYFISPEDIAKEGNSPLLEVPMTIFTEAEAQFADLTDVVGKKDSNILQNIFRKRNNKMPRPLWLRPNGCNLFEMKAIIDHIIEKKYNYAMFMIHSSELMPGGSPNFINEEIIENLYWDVEQLFRYTAEKFSGSTLNEFHDSFIQS
ncbi:MAG: hypothetical protein ABR968_10035 [Bacteroidales bacterium]|jgi:hypothetical protein